MKKWIIVALAAGAFLVAGCNTGSRDRSAGGGSSKSYYGPGSTGASGAGASTGGGSGVGAFSAGPDLQLGRGQHTATLLADGRVLVTGGFAGGSILPSSELLDPGANAWTDVRDLAPTPDEGLMQTAVGFTTARRHHSAALLNDGRVLIAGGHGAEREDANGNPVFEALETAFVFDPTLDGFRQVGDLSEPRYFAHMAAFNDGTAVLAGGVTRPTVTNSLRSAEVFDPLSNTFASSQTVTMSDYHTHGVAVGLENDRMLIYGGADVVEERRSRQLQNLAFVGQTSELYESADQTFRRPPPTTAGPLTDAGGVLLSTGDAFFAGGRREDPALPTQFPVVLNLTVNTLDLGYATPDLEVTKTAERWSRQTESFEALPELSEARWGAQVAELANSTDVIVIGGVDAGNGLMTSCEVWSGLHGAWLGTCDLATPRHQFRALTLRDGRVVVIGGLDPQLNGIASTELHTR